MRSRISLTTVIAQVGERIAGVVFSFSVDFDSLPPVAKKIVELYPDLTRDDWFYGPVCISEIFAGRAYLLNYVIKYAR